MRDAARFQSDETTVFGALFEEIAAQSPDVEGVSRPAFSETETRTLEVLADFARGHGLSVWFDEGRNARFSLPEDREAERYVVVGSHVDSVPFGGNYDGLAGVLAGVACLVRARRTGARFARPVHVLAMRGEESAWFGPCYIGSKVLTGTLDESELQALHKGDGRSLADHMAETGLPVKRIARAIPLADLSAMEAYIEVHIEQGPLLIGKGLPAAVVSGIRGNFRHREVRCIGETGHSGAVPRAYRRDPVLAMADLLVRLDESWQTILNKGADLVLTSGIVGTDPQKHAMTRIPDSIAFSLDIRSQSTETLDQMREMGCADLFWGEDVSPEGRTQKIARSHRLAEEFDGKFAPLENRRTALLDEIAYREGNLNELAYLHNEVTIELEESRYDYVIERAANDDKVFRPGILPWSRTEEDRQRLRKALLASLLLMLVIGGVPLIWEVPARDPGERVEIPERLARMVKEKVPPKPVERPPEQPREEVREEPKPEQPQVAEQRPEPTPEEVRRARTTAVVAALVLPAAQADPGVYGHAAPVHPGYASPVAWDAGAAGLYQPPYYHPRPARPAKQDFNRKVRPHKTQFQGPVAPAAYVGPGYPYLNAPLFPTPRPDIPYQTGVTLITNQALAPHEMLYPHTYKALYPPFYYTNKGTWVVTPLGVWSTENWSLVGTEVSVKYKPHISPFALFHPPVHR
jgi:beta-ureidopropionase / N-carbamoyl-L-amino-acid hydrolase